MIKKGQVGASGIIGLIIMIVSLIIGIVIIDDIIKTTRYHDTVENESHTLTAVPQNITLNNIPIPTAHTPTITNVTGDTVLDATNFTIISRPLGIIQINSNYANDTEGMELYVDYSYVQSAYMDNSLSRTISAYIVPITLLALLGLVAFFVLRLN